MKIIPVIDLLHGQVVHAIAGRREQYRPIVSRLTRSSEPLDVASAFADHFGFDEIYIADLDAIAGLPPDLRTLNRLRENGFHTSVDAGIRSTHQAIALAEHATNVIAALETLGPADLNEVYQSLQDRTIFSLDLKDGKTLASATPWRDSEPYDIASQVIHMGFERLIVLDLGRVGTGAGTGTEELCCRIRTDFPSVKLYAGGGIRSMDDVHRFADVGVAGLLIASALHDGTITRANLNR